MNAIELVRPGILSTIQDLGRFGYQEYGISTSGAMDKFALRVANLLVGNDEGEAAMEMTILGPELKVINNVTAAFTGAPFSPQVNGESVPMWQSVLLRAGDIVSFSAAAPDAGLRAYLALGGGIDVPLVMGSRSTHVFSQLGGQDGRRLQAGDVLRVRKAISPSSRSLPPEQIPAYPDEIPIRVIPGPQADYFSAAGLEAFFAGEYQITPRSDRRGYVLAGPKIEHACGPDVISDGIIPGCIQVPGDGMPIILLADCQTTGGFAKIATVISPDLDKLAQAGAGHKIRFQQVDIARAYQIGDETESQISYIRTHLLGNGGKC